ncbi:MAG: hypothetical protein ACLQGV_06255 [Bryobacteraceae bacterium]
MVPLAGASLVVILVGYAALVDMAVQNWDPSTAEGCWCVLTLAATYLWNLILIGVPAMHLCTVGRWRLLRHIGLVTLVGLAVVLANVIALDRIPPSSFRLGEALFLIFGTSGAAVGWLVWFLVRRKWGGTNRAALVMAFVTAILANPALALLPLPLIRALVPAL